MIFLLLLGFSGILTALGIMSNNSFILVTSLCLIGLFVDINIDLNEKKEIVK